MNNVAIQTISDLIQIPAFASLFLYIGFKLHALQRIEEYMKVVGHNMGVVTNYLTKAGDGFEPNELKQFSPFQLTEEGLELIKRVSFDVICRDNEVVFFEEMNRLGVLGTKYDVEKAAIRSIYFLMDQSFMTPVKVFLYNNPKRTIENIAPTLGVYLRDNYLERHPEIIE